MADYNPCCKYPLNNPPLPLYKSSSTSSINVVEVIPTPPGFDNIKYDDYPDIEDIKGNTSNFTTNDIAFVKEIYDSIEGLGDSLSAENLDNATIAANYKLSPEFRCHTCRRITQFQTVSGGQSFISFVSKNSSEKASEYFQIILNCREFGLAKEGGAIDIALADSYAGKLRDGKCNIEEKKEEIGKNFGDSASFKNLCDIILAETIKSYLL